MNKLIAVLAATFFASTTFAQMPKLPDLKIDPKAAADSKVEDEKAKAKAAADAKVEEAKSKALGGFGIKK